MSFLQVLVCSGVLPVCVGADTLWFLDLKKEPRGNCLFFVTKSAYFGYLEEDELNWTNV